MTCRTLRFRNLIGGVLLAATGAHALTFNFLGPADMDPGAMAGFQQAGTLWASRIGDPITVTVKIGFGDLSGYGRSVVGVSNYTLDTMSYGTFLDALAAHRSSADDQSAAVAVGPTLQMLINHVSNSPNGPSSPIPFLSNGADGINTQLIMTTANERALGIYGLGVWGLPITDFLGNPISEDGSIILNSRVAWDFDRSNGIDIGKLDLVGTVLHELGHTLGFYSGVDAIDAGAQFARFSGYPAQYGVVSPFDLFRCSDESAAIGVPDVSADSRRKFFSVDDCQSAVADLSTGYYKGDGAQASHWKAGLGLGLMDPFIFDGQTLAIAENDLRALDVIGYSVAAVPEPGPAALLGLGLAVLGILQVVHRPPRRPVLR